MVSKTVAVMCAYSLFVSVSGARGYGGALVCRGIRKRQKEAKERDLIV